MTKKIGTIKELKEAVRLEDFAGRYTELRKIGRRFQGMSPFNSERTPSFFVDSVTQRYTDYSGGKSESGDLIDFYRRLNPGADIGACIEGIARENGLSYEMPQYMKERSEKGKIMQDYIGITSSNLKRDRNAAEHLKARGIDAKSAGEYELGFSMHDDLARLKGMGYTDDEIKKAGLVNRAGHPYFQGRITVPVKDLSGRTAGFTGRGIRKDEKIKYLHSAGLPKESILYGTPSHIIRSEGYVVLAEGPFDVMALRRASLPAVCGLGATVSEKQAGLIAECTSNVLLLYDGDSAGRKGADAAGLILTAAGLNVKVAVLPDNMDPEEYVNSLDNATAGMKEFLRGAAVTYFDYLLSDIDLDDNRGRHEAVTRLMPFFGAAGGIDRDWYIKELSKRFHMPLGETAGLFPGMFPEYVMERDGGKSDKGLYDLEEELFAAGMASKALLETEGAYSYAVFGRLISAMKENRQKGLRMLDGITGGDLEAYRKAKALESPRDWRTVLEEVCVYREAEIEAEIARLTRKKEGIGKLLGRAREDKGISKDAKTTVDKVRINVL